MRKLKITSLILVVVMLLGMIPMGIFSASAAVTAPTTVPNGSVSEMVDVGKTRNLLNASTAMTKKDASIPIGSKVNYQWRGAEGFLLKVKTTAATQFYFDAQMPAGAFGWASYMRIGMAQSKSGFLQAKFGSLESDVYIYDGTTWTKQTTNNWDDSYIDLPANFEGYVYSPFDQWYWQGNGSTGSSIDNIAFNVGCSAEEFLVHYEKPIWNELAVWTATPNVFTVETADIVYADKDLAPKDGDIAEAYQWTSSSTDAATGGKTYTERLGQQIGDWVEYSLNKGDGKPDNGVYVSSANSTMDLSDAKGVSVHVDTTNVTAGRQLQFRPYLQYLGGFSDTIYRDNMIINETSNIDGVATTTAGQEFYVSYYADESYCQFVTRTPGSMVYLRADGSDEWTPLYNYCTGAGIASWGGFLLPEGFKGDVYVPMDSYWFCSSNNSGNIIIPFELSLVKDFKSFGLFSSLNSTPAEGEENSVIYSDYTVWRDSSYNEVEIGTADELVYFFDHLNEYNGKNVKLTADIVLNAGWDAASKTAPAVKLANRTAANTYFAGNFDGQGHVISGLYLESNLNALGLFGNVNHKTQATVKNVTILNSYINQTGGAQVAVTSVGLTAAGGSIFGQVMGDPDVAGTWIDDPNYVNQTKATIINVYADVDIDTVTTGGNGMTGYGGIIGVLQSDALIQQTTFAGNIKAHLRGTAGFVGSIYPYQPVVDHDHDGATVKQSDNKYYKNNDMAAGVLGTENKAVNANQVNLVIYESSFTGSVANDTRGFVGGVIGYNNVNQCNITLGSVIITGSIRSEKLNGDPYGGGTGGFILGGSWASVHGDRVKGHKPEYADYRIFNVTAYNVETDTATQAFAQTNGALRVFYDVVNIDWDADGKFERSEYTYKNALADINKCICLATAAEIPAIINRRDLMDTSRFSLTLDADLTYKVQIPVGAVVLGPDVDINNVAKVQVNGSNSSIQLKLSDDYTYWEGELKLLPQDITTSLRFYFSGAKFDQEAKVAVLTIHDKSDTANWSTSAVTAETYLRNLAKDADSTAEVKDLVVDTLKYASETREFHGLSALNTSNLEGGAEFDVQEVVDNFSDSLYIDNDEHSFEYLAFRCDTKLAVQIGVNAAGAYTATLDGEAVEVDTTTAADGYILIYINPLNWNAELQVNDPNTATTMYYTLTDYFAWVLNEETDVAQRQKDLVSALYGYMLSLQAYAESIAE